jgi:hypothetical protein
VVAFFGILFTGRYPRSIFDYNVGVLRWTWRVHYYTFGALATDRYPPFSLQDVPDYPAHLDINYPGQLSRGLVLVKWWLLAIPHYLVIAVFLGGGTWLAWHADPQGVAWPVSGLIGLLAILAAVVLLFTGRYPESIYDFVLGMNRWVLRVAAYAALMTDEYPPFRMDMGGHEPGGPGATLTLPETPPPAESAPVPEAPAPPHRGWTGGRIASLIVGVLVTLLSLGLLAAGGVAVWATNARNGGYVTSDARNFHSSGYAVTSERISIGDGVFNWGWQGNVLGTVRLRVTGANTATPVFVGIAATDEVNRYLADVRRTELNDLIGDDRVTVIGSRAPSVAPTASDIWVASASGVGRQSINWDVENGDWTMVAMNASGAPDVAVRADIGATFPSLKWVALGLLIAGTVLLAAGVLMIVLPIHRAHSVG